MTRNNTHRSFSFRLFSIPHFHRSTIFYIAVGSTCGVIFVVAVIVAVCYLRQSKPNSSFQNHHDGLRLAFFGNDPAILAIYAMVQRPIFILMLLTNIHKERLKFSRGIIRCGNSCFAVTRPIVLTLSEMGPGIRLSMMWGGGGGNAMCP